MTTQETLPSTIHGDVRWNERLDGHTWYRIGGSCDVYCLPSTIDDLKRLSEWCKIQNRKMWVLGKGSNVLISDNGLRGVVVDLERCAGEIRIEGDRVEAGAGVQVPKLVLECERAGLGGIEMFAGIPGTVGGAVRMNAGCHGKEMFDVITHVTWLHDGDIVKTPKEMIPHGYRHVDAFHDERDVVLSAMLQLQRDDPGRLAESRKAFMKKRQHTQPINLPSSGSVFKNPPGDHAARLIDACGLKGYRVGKAMISDKHANFFVNLGGATATDVLALIRHARIEVHRRFGIRLELEVQLFGFREEELKSVGLA